MSETRVMPIGAQNFQALRENRFIYVDKTHYVYQLISQSRVYFLSRPRRFGKSLLLSTLSAYFSGKKELFKGLYLEQVEPELAAREKRDAWLEHPVLYLDLNARNYENREALVERLSLCLQKWEKIYAINKVSESLEERFAYVIERAYEQTGRQVVVLIDEYDKPLLDTIDKPQLNDEYRDILRAFFSVIKSSDRYLRFAFLTGVTRFSKVSVFSGLNNLKDISLRDDFSGICGITESELKTNFVPEIEALALKQKKSSEEVLATLKKRYDGYLFAAEGENVYNPFSLLNAFDARSFSDYWYATGTPTFLVEYLRTVHYNIPDLDGNVFLNERNLEHYRADAQNVLPILYQAGYLTIKEFIVGGNVYRLGFPNDEVRYGFLDNLLPAFTSVGRSDTGHAVWELVKAIQSGDVDGFMMRIQSILSGIPYDTIPAGEVTLRERDYQIAVYLVFSLVGEFVQTEVQNASGRADCVVHTANSVYLFELKLWSKGTAADALSQIKSNGYDVPYRSSGKRLILVGASFDEKKRTLGTWEIEEQ